MQNFINQLEKIKKEFEEESLKKNQFNIFSALHKETSEKQLHSRFISYLLSPVSKHGMGDTFLKAFIETISESYSHIKEYNIENSCVRPNEKDKREYKDIDILIKNNKQVIILENKIFAKDSTHFNKDPENQIQLQRYYNIIKKDNDKDIFAIYLTLDRHDPEQLDKIRKSFPVYKIDYRKEIIIWLNKCIDFVSDPFMKNILDQYKAIVINLTNDVDRARELKFLIANNIEEAWSKYNEISDMPDFKHVKWHTVDDFWIELAKCLEENLNVKILKQISMKEITKVTHKSRVGSFGLTLKSPKNEFWYIVNDIKEGLTYGRLNSETKIKGKDWFSISNDIKFSEFSNKETFELIDPQKIDRLTNYITDSLGKVI